MKKILISLLFLINSIGFLYAQDEEAAKKNEKIQALKVAFITQKLELSSEDAQKFWPVYSRYENDMKQAITTGGQGDVLARDEQLLNIRKKYRNEFSTVLGNQRVNTLFKTENDFRGILMRHLRNSGANPQRNMNRTPQRRMMPNRP
ncbi:hypothetical protein BH09BAC2_BH09BAC2_06440 [soil metagenome]